MILPYFFQQFPQAPLGTIEFFVGGSGTGTDIPKNVFADKARTNPLPQPLQLDAYGTAPEYFVESGIYFIVVRRANGTILVTRDQVSASEGGGDASSKSVASVSSFPAAQINWITDPDSEIFRDDGCFCWILPAYNIDKIKWFKTISGHNTTVSVGKVSIWGGVALDFVDAIKLAEFPLPDVDGIRTQPLDLDTSFCRWIGVACDPGLMDPGVPVMQTGLTLPTAPVVMAPKFLGYVGQHVHNETFDEFPPIYAADAKYMLTRWMELGLIYKDGE